MNSRNAEAIQPVRSEHLSSLEIFSTCPQSGALSPKQYRERVIDVARWSEEAGCAGILVYTDNSLVDPWLTAQIIIENTRALCPLVAVQPVYMHPYTVAKMVASYGYLYGRRVFLNMVAGGFKNDLTALNDLTPHDQRYDRLIEYTTIIRQLLSTSFPISYSGRFYTVDKLKMTPSLSPELFPGIFISGSSAAGMAAAEATKALAVQYPQPVSEYEAVPPDRTLTCGMRIGIIARTESAEAWRVAHERFPEDRKGQLAHQLAMKVSDSAWHRQLSAMGTGSVSEQQPYWLFPFQNYQTFCPYLVGSYQCVAQELARYIAVGYRTFILDIPPDEEELRHINHVFTQADSLQENVAAIAR